jgi:hypothetical protein
MDPTASVLGTIDGAARVRGIHGGVGDLYWTRLVTGGHMHGEWESFEYARLEPGVLELDGQEISLGPGDSLVT